MLLFDGLSDMGLEKDLQEDAIYHKQFDKDTHLFIIADGTGLVNEQLSPAVIACSEISDPIQRWLQYNKDTAIENMEFILKEALLGANRVLGTFHVADDEMFKGFGTSVSVCLINNNRLTYAHCGNTRIHLMRVNKKGELVLKQLTVDHTEGYEKLARQELTEELYLKGIEKMNLTSCIGAFPSPMIQTSTMKFEENNILVMTTDGIHYPLWRQSILELAFKADNTLSACKALIDAAKIQKYPDNMAVFVIYNVPDKAETKNTT